MVNSRSLDIVFRQFLANEVSNELLKSIEESVSVEDIDALLRSVESLGDPSEHCKNDHDDQTPAGFFLYVDFISALIIHLGEPAIQEAGQFENTEHPFVRWVIKYVGDDRFHEEIASKFSGVLTR